MFLKKELDGSLDRFLGIRSRAAVHLRGRFLLQSDMRGNGGGDLSVVRRDQGIGPVADGEGDRARNRGTAVPEPDKLRVGIRDQKKRAERNQGKPGEAHNRSQVYDKNSLPP